MYARQSTLYPAATFEDFQSGRPIYHRSCGNELTPPEGLLWFRCIPCRKHWLATTWANFSDQDLADRFYVKPKPQDTGAVTLVWKTEGKNRFTTLVPSEQADQYEKVVF